MIYTALLKISFFYCFFFKDQNILNIIVQDLCNDRVFYLSDQHFRTQHTAQQTGALTGADWSQLPETSVKFDKMAAQYNFKPEFLENTIKSLQCFKCKDVPGFDKEQKNRYSCHDNAHQLCEKCKNGPCECGSTIGKIPNPVVHEILKDMPMFCPHYKRGCRQVSAQSEDLKVRKIQK